MKNRIIDDEFINRIETLSIEMKSSMQGYFGGNHKVKTYGSTVEFADFREYTLGDDIRRIDWNLYARFEKHFIKLFVDERQMHVQIYLDTSASMYKVNNEKAYFALRIAAALGYLTVNNMDKLSYVLMNKDYSCDLCGLITGKDSYYRAVAELEKTEFHNNVNIDNAVMSYGNIGTNNGLSIIISDFLNDENWKKAVNYLVYKKRSVLLIQVLSDEECDPSFNGRMSFIDSESTDINDELNMKMKVNKASIMAYKEALADYQKEIKEYCLKRGAYFVSVKSSDSIEKLIFEGLGKVGIVK